MARRQRGIADRVRAKFRKGEYEFTLPHFFEELAADSLTLADAESILLRGQVSRRFKGDPRGARYEVSGRTVDGRRAAIVWPPQVERRLAPHHGLRAEGRMKSRVYDYGDCHVCSASLEARRVRQDFWIRGRLVVVDAVPAGVCPQCSARVVHAETGRQLAHLLSRGRVPRGVRRISVPVVRFRREIA